MQHQKQTIYNFSSEEVGSCLMLMYDSDDEIERLQDSQQQGTTQNKSSRLVMSQNSITHQSRKTQF
ncbi:hypothetical protein pb186bvf_020612 [Paramecium bursaria]